MKKLQDLLKLRSLDGVLDRFSSRALLFLVGGLFVADLVLLDPLPWVDEILLGGLTLLVARWSSGREERRAEEQRRQEFEGQAGDKPPPKNVTPPAAT
ncbi:MAG: DUF6116 family protein [Acidobacteriota bacterium]